MFHKNIVTLGSIYKQCNSIIQNDLQTKKHIKRHEEGIDN